MPTKPFLTIPSTSIHWLWPNRIPRGKITLLIGDPGVGKSLFTLDLAARLSRVTPFPEPVTSAASHDPSGLPLCDPPEISNSEISNLKSQSTTLPDTQNPVSDTLHPVPHSAFSTLLLTSDDDPSDTIRPRLQAAGADLSRIHLIQGITTLAPNSLHNQEPEAENPQTPLALLEAAIQSTPDLALLIIDPITSFLGFTDRLAHHRTRTVLTYLADLAARYNIAIILTTRLNKAVSTSPIKTLYRATGSLAFASVARAIWLLTPAPNNTLSPSTPPALSDLPSDTASVEGPLRDPSNPNISNLKSEPALASERTTSLQTANPQSSFVISYSSLPQPILFLPIKLNLAIHPPGLAFNIVDNKIVYHSDPVSLNSAILNPPGPIVAVAMTWLTRVLADGPISSDRIKDEAKNNYITYNALRHAQVRLGIDPFKVSYRKGWFWCLPGDTRPAPTFNEEWEHQTNTALAEMNVFTSTPTDRQRQAAVRIQRRAESYAKTINKARC